MARNKRAANLAAAKQKKQKMIAIGGSVLLLAVLAFSVPKTLKMMKGPQPVPDSPAQAAPTAAPTPAPGVAAPAATPEVVAGELADTGGMPEATEGQLISFERFASKDPFAQQVEATADAPAAAAAPPSGVPDDPEQPEAPAQEPSATPGSPSSPSAPSAPAPTTPTKPTTPASAPAEKPKAAVISINGVQETVEVGAAFPKEEEVFELVSLTTTSAKIGIAGGSLTGGAATITIEKGKKVTLQNTADGTQYELVLVSLS
jgi:hypothetical protein